MFKFLTGFALGAVAGWIGSELWWSDTIEAADRVPDEDWQGGYATGGVAEDLLQAGISIAQIIQEERRKRGLR